MKDSKIIMKYGSCYIFGPDRVGSYTVSCFPSDEVQDRLFIRAMDCRLTTTEAAKLRDFLDDWLSQYDLDIKKTKNLNSKVIKALRYIEK